jgi:hypothetical protein
MSGKPVPGGITGPPCDWGIYMDLVLQVGVGGESEGSQKPRAVNIIMIPVGFGTKNHCAGENQQPFSSQLWAELSVVQETWRLHTKTGFSPY